MPFTGVAAGAAVWGLSFVVAIGVVAGSAFGAGPVDIGQSEPGCSQICGLPDETVPVGPADRFGLPAGYTISTDADSAEIVVVEYALAQLGKPYVWGAAGPDAFDCSGLTMMAWGSAGIPLAHYTVDQLAEGTSVTDLSLMAPGDLVLTPGSDGTLRAPGHVGLYLGDGLVESALDPADGVVVQSWADFTAGGLSGVRHIG